MYVLHTHTHTQQPHLKQQQQKQKKQKTKKQNNVPEYILKQEAKILRRLGLDGHLRTEVCF